jgi:hypothetical protein
MKKLLSCCEGGQLKENNVKETSPAVEAKRFSTIVTKATLILVSLAVFLPAPSLVFRTGSRCESSGKTNSAWA